MALIDTMGIVSFFFLFFFFFFFWLTSLLFLFQIHFFLFFKLLFSYSCLHFLPIPPPHPRQTHLPPLPPPSPLVLSMCPLQQFLKAPLPSIPSPLSSGYCQIALNFNVSGYILFDCVSWRRCFLVSILVGNLVIFFRKIWFKIRFQLLEGIHMMMYSLISFGSNIYFCYQFLPWDP